MMQTTLKQVDTLLLVRELNDAHPDGTKIVVKVVSSGACLAPGCYTDATLEISAAKGTLDSKVADQVLADHDGTPPRSPEDQIKSLQDAVDKLVLDSLTGGGA